MTARSTRNKLLHQTKKIDLKFNQIFEHARFLEELAGGESKPVNEMLPVLVGLTKANHDFWQDLFENL